jgi:hypothetical protein
MLASLLAVLADSEPRRSVSKISRSSNSTARVPLVAAMEELLEDIVGCGEGGEAAAVVVVKGTISVEEVVAMSLSRLWESTSPSASVDAAAAAAATAAAAAAVAASRAEERGPLGAISVSCMRT